MKEIPLRILAIDPGDRTGLASLNTKTYEFESWEFDDVDQLLLAMEETAHKYDLIIIEDFLINAETHKKKKPVWGWPLETIGALKRIFRKRHIAFIMQIPAERMWATDWKLQKLGWYKGTSAKTDTEGHADDAARHLAVYLGTKLYDKTFLERLKDDFAS
jgi:hypothetical protein